MKRLLVLFAAGYAGGALAQGAPVVVPNTGEATYRYEFPLPKARGRFQPILALNYSSNAGAGPYGYGWSLSGAYIERPTRRRDQFWLVQDGARRLLVLVAQTASEKTYRPEIQSGFLELKTQNADDPASWTGTDAVGNTYAFAYRPGIDRWYLTTVTDVDQNATTFGYQPESGESALLASVRYNWSTAGAGTANDAFDVSVTLTYGANPRPVTQVVAGSVVDRVSQLSTVTVTSAGANRRFVLGYVPAAESQQSVLKSITEYGTDGLTALRPTSFGYGAAEGPSSGTFSLAAATGIYVPQDTSGLLPTGCTAGSGWCTGIAGAAWIDLDGDGRPDLAWGGASTGIKWARNITPAGSSSLQFDLVRLIGGSQTFPGQVTFAYPLGDKPARTGVVFSRIMDINGDGIPDLASIVSGALEIRLGTGSGPALSYASPTYSVPPGGATIADPSKSKNTLDIDGDGVVDVVSIGSTPSGAGSFLYYGQWGGGGLSFGTAVPLYIDLSSLASDATGDGLTDAVTALSYPGYPWGVTFNDGRGFANSQRRSWTQTGDATPWPPPGDETGSTGLVTHLNGDGIPDYVFKTWVGSAWCAAAPCNMIVSWGNGQGFNVGQFTLGMPSMPAWAWSLGTPPQLDIYPYSTRWGGTGDNGRFVDANGDGVPDYVLMDFVHQRMFFFPGSNGRDTGRDILLKQVVTPLGAQYDLTYAPATRFGFDTGIPPQPVVTQLGVSGTALEANTISYWYSGPVRARAWDDPTRWEPRGFSDTWVQDAVTGIVKHTVWQTYSHAAQGSPTLFEWGTPTSTGTTTIPPSSTVFSRTTYAVSARTAGGTCASVPASGADFVSADYPLIPFPSSAVQTRFAGTVQLQSATTIACGDVDANGNVLKRTVYPTYPDPAPSSARVEWANFDGTATCKSCPVQTKMTDAAGNLLAQSLFYYDSPVGISTQPLPNGQAGKGHLNYVGRLTTLPPAAAIWEVASTTVYNTDGTVASITRGTAVESFTYDATGTRVTRRTATDGGKTLVTDTSYDGAGRPAVVTGPYLAGSTAPVSQRAFAYDAFGRLRLESRVPVSSGTVTQPIAAYQYFDQQLPVAVKAHTFAAPISYTDGAIPTTSDVKVNIVYLDGLGRTIQRRERLGGTGSGDPSAMIAQNLTGYRVSGAVVYDGAGRVRAEIEPFYSGTDAFVDYRTSLEATSTPLHASLKTYDAQGRITCSVYAVVSGTLPASVPCTSSFLENSGYQLASVFQYAGVVDNGRNLLSVTTIAPEQTAATPYGRGGQALYDAGGRVVATLDAFGNRAATTYDLLGRVTQVTRLSTDPTQQSHGYTLGYDGLGRVIFRTERDAGTRAMSYNPQGQLVRVVLPTRTLSNGTQASDELTYTYRAFGRLEQVDSQEWQVDAAGLASLLPRQVASFSYDTPYAGGSYGYTAGRMASAANDVTTIAFGYDQDGNQTLRDQWFPGVAGRFAVSRGIGNDGRLLWQMFSSSHSASLAWMAQYDSAGRPVKLFGSDTYWQTPPPTQPDGTTSGSYDALGRLGTILTDNGLTTTQRAYGAFSGTLTSHSVIAGTNLLYSAQQITYLGGKLQSFNDQVGQTSYAYQYDEKGRLVQSTANPTGASNVSQSFDELYSFSTNRSFTSGASFDNLERVLDQRSSTDETYAYPAGSDQVTSISKTTPVVSNTSTYDYDGAGRLIRKNGTGEAFAYDTQDHLVSIVKEGVTVETLQYGPFGALVSRQVGTKTIYYVGSYGTVTVESAAVAVDAHVQLGGLRIASVSAARTMYYYRDRQGSITSTTLAGGTPGTLYRYTPYGALDKVDVRAPGAESELGYTGQLKLSGGLIYLNARVYDPGVRRFLQADTVDPLRYTYTEGDPINGVDPSGLANNMLVPCCGLWPCEIPFGDGPSPATVPADLIAGSQGPGIPNGSISEDPITGPPPDGVPGNPMEDSYGPACPSCGSGPVGSSGGVGEPPAGGGGGGRGGVGVRSGPGEWAMQAATRSLNSPTALGRVGWFAWGTLITPMRWNDAITFAGYASVLATIIFAPPAALVATEVAAQQAAVAARGGAGAINVTEKGLAHVLERHVAGGALATGNKSIFAAGENLPALIRGAGSVAPTVQSAGRLAYTVNAGRIIGIDRATGAGTSVYTVITEATGELVTAFPGIPLAP